MYRLFLFDRYYPAGGMNDLAGEFSSIEEALKAAKESTSDYYQVVNSDFIVCALGSVGSF